MEYKGYSDFFLFELSKTGIYSYYTTSHADVKFYPRATSSTIMVTNPTAKRMVPVLIL